MSDVPRPHFSAENLVDELRENYDASQLRLHRAEAALKLERQLSADNERQRDDAEATIATLTTQLAAAEKVCEAAQRAVGSGGWPPHIESLDAALATYHTTKERA